MSRIGNKEIIIPAGVTVSIDDNNTALVKGPKGTLNFTFNKNMKIKIEGQTINIARPSESKFDKSIHGTSRALLNNMVLGVSEGFSKTLEIKGVGYRAQLQGNKLTVNAGYSNPVVIMVPEGIKVELPKPIEIIISGTDKQAVGEFAANIRSIRKPEPYKGKGIKYSTEHVRRKEGKTAS